jgi:hypothetical protein
VARLEITWGAVASAWECLGIPWRRGVGAPARGGGSEQRVSDVAGEEEEEEEEEEGGRRRIVELEAELAELRAAWPAVAAEAAPPPGAGAARLAARHSQQWWLERWAAVGDVALCPS